MKFWLHWGLSFEFKLSRACRKHQTLPETSAQAHTAGLRHRQTLTPRAVSPDVAALCGRTIDGRSCATGRPCRHAAILSGAGGTPGSQYRRCEKLTHEMEGSCDFTQEPAHSCATRSASRLR